MDSQEQTNTTVERPEYGAEQLAFVYRVISLPYRAMPGIRRRNASEYRTGELLARGRKPYPCLGSCPCPTGTASRVYSAFVRLAGPSDGHLSNITALPK